MLHAANFRYNEPMKATASPKNHLKAAALTDSDIDHITKLANIPLTPEQASELTQQVGVTVGYVSQLQSVNTEDVVETSQVTGLENVLREDEIDQSRMLTQEEALSGAKRTHNGFFVVDRIFEEK